MKGLILNNFYSMSGNIKLSFLMAAGLGVILSIVGEGMLLPIVIAIQIFVFIANVGTSLQADETSKWNRYQITLPIRRNTVIGAKYISFVILILFGLLVSAATGILYVMVGWEVQTDRVVYGTCFGLTMAIACAAFLYPAILKFGAEKSELFIFLSAAAANGIILLVTFLLSAAGKDINFNSPMAVFFSTLVSVILFVGSYFLSLKIYRMQEL